MQHALTLGMPLGSRPSRFPASVKPWMKCSLMACWVGRVDTPHGWQLPELHLWMAKEQGGACLKLLPWKDF
jgi:hypothetical protein